MGVFRDLTGQKFGKLTVLGLDHAESRSNGRGHNFYYKCQCECGNFCVVRGASLTSSNTKSCGCILEHHGQSNTALYYKYIGMCSRCSDSKAENYSRYGGRGIKVCDRWLNSFKSFYEDVSKLPHFGEEGYSLDRIDNNGDYCPENVRWATAKEQVCNRRNNIIVEYQGEKMCLKETAEKSGIPYNVLFKRYKNGKRAEALFAPINKKYSHKNNR